MKILNWITEQAADFYEKVVFGDENWHNHKNIFI